MHAVFWRPSSSWGWTVKACLGFGLALLAASTQAEESGVVSGRWAPTTGLVAMGSLTWNTTNPTTPPPNNMAEPLAHPGVYSAAVCDLRWSDLQPVQGGPIVTTTADACLANIAAYNALYPATPMTAMFRIYTGQNAPSWAQSLNGGPMSMVENGGFSVGLWWAASYRAAWISFQNAMAAIYNTNPLVHEIAVTSCSAHTAEPFVEPLGTTDLATLVANGYTDAQEFSCLNGTQADYAAWTKPALEYTFNSWRTTTSGAAVFNPVNTISVLVSHRLNYGSAGIIANHGLDSTIASQDQPYYAYFTSLGAPISFQYNNSAAQTNDAATCPSYGTPYNVSRLEMWDTTAAGGSATNTLAQLQACAAALGGY